MVFVFLQALWMMEPKEISDWQHEEFYRYVAQAYDKPRYTLHYRADAPLNIRSIFYVPEAVSLVSGLAAELCEILHLGNQRGVQVQY